MIKAIIISTPFSEARGPGLLTLIGFCMNLLNGIRHEDREREGSERPTAAGSVPIYAPILE